MKNLSELTQHQKILTTMCRNQDQEWWFPYDFMGDMLGDLFVGYEASARLSELAKDYPDMIASEQAGKYIKRRVRFETIEQWFPELPKDLRYVFHRAGLTKNIKQPTQAMEPSLPPATGKGSKVIAIYKGRTYNTQGYQSGQQYELKIDRLKVGKPVRILTPFQRIYPTMEAFIKEWAVDK